MKTATHIEAAVDGVFRIESFATGLLCELDTTRGLLTWISVGHYEPLLLREGRWVRALEVEPLLPMGLNEQLSRTAPVPVGTEQLQPGDMLLLTDGAIEARSPDGRFFGQDRLIDCLASTCGVPHQLPRLWRQTTKPVIGEAVGLLLTRRLVRATLRDAVHDISQITDEVVEHHYRRLRRTGAWPAQLRFERASHPEWVELPSARSQLPHFDTRPWLTSELGQHPLELRQSTG